MKLNHLKGRERKKGTGVRSSGPPGKDERERVKRLRGERKESSSGIAVVDKEDTVRGEEWEERCKERKKAEEGRIE